MPVLRIRDDFPGSRSDQIRVFTKHRITDPESGPETLIPAFYKFIFIPQGMNSSLASDLGKFPTLWRVIEQMKTKNTDAATIIRGDLIKVTNLILLSYSY